MAAFRPPCHRQDMADTILIIDDDARLSGMLAEYLGGSGFLVLTAPDGEAGLAAVEREAPAAVILDVMLPGIDGFEVCRRLRSRNDVPILMLTAKGDDFDRIVGLEIGADDYLPKPFNPRELLARLKAILRRRKPVEAEGGALRFGSLVIDPGSRIARLNGQAVSLTSHQFELLLAFATHAGRVLSRDQLMDFVKGEELEAFDRSIDVHVSKIRAAIESDPKEPRRILTVRGAGYVFARVQD
jgi:two-component system, OmpR family, phosphate regulon response regulator OmpR